MSGERRRRVVAMLVDGSLPGFGIGRLCQRCAEVTGTSGAGIMLISDDAAQGSICNSNPVSALLEQLQYELGEGPCLEAYREGRPVIEPNLADPTTRRWIAFAGSAVEAGVGAVFGFPLRVGAIRLGALDLYCESSGPLTDDQHADALVVADVAASVLIMESHAPFGELADDLVSGDDFRDVVHQASGMVAAQLEADVRQAMVRLRAYAFGNGRRLIDVAQDVVARNLRFDEESGERDPTP